MYSPVASTLRGEDIATLSHQQTTCQIDPDVAAQATRSLLDAFNNDPMDAVEQEIMVAIGTPVLDVDPDNPYRVTCRTDVAYMRIDTAGLDDNCKEVTCCCEIRPVSGEFRIHLIGNMYAIVDTRNTNHLVQPWALCSRNADLTMRYKDSCAAIPFVYKAANRIYAPLPRAVEDYVTHTLQRTVLDGRACAGAIASGTGPDVLPFELSLDDYLITQRDFDVFDAYIDTVRKSTNHTICWDHYGCGDGTTYTDTRVHTDTTMTLPAELIAAAASTTTAKELSHRLFGVRTTKNVVRAVGQASSLGTLACAMALITDDTPPDWIAGIINQVNDYSADARAQYDVTYDVAASMAASVSLMQPYIEALDAHHYTRMLKPLATGNISLADQLLDCAVGNCGDTSDPYMLHSSDAHCAVSVARPTSMHYNDVIRDIDMAVTRTLGDYIRACGIAVGDIQHSLDAYSMQHPPLSITAFLRWAQSPAGQVWQRSRDNAEAYFASILNTRVYNQLVERLDGMCIRDIGVQLRLARSTAEYISLGTTLSNCIKDYSYDPAKRSIIAIHEGDAASKPVAAMEINPNTVVESMINQIYAKANRPYHYGDRVKDIVRIEANTLRTQLRTQQD